MILLQKRCRILSLPFLLASLFSLSRAFNVADGFAEAGEVRESSKAPVVEFTRKPVADVNLTEAVRCALDRAMAEIERNSDTTALLRVEASKVRVLQSPALAEMFPHDVFIYVPFRVDEGPASKGRLAGMRGVPVSTTFVFDKDTGEAAEIPSDRYEGFARLLAKRKVALKSPKDAERIWACYCALGSRSAPGARHAQVGEHTWRLNWHRQLEGRGDTSKDYFYEITTGPDGIVTGGKLQSAPPSEEKGKGGGKGAGNAP